MHNCNSKFILFLYYMKNEGLIWPISKRLKLEIRLQFEHNDFSKFDISSEGSSKPKTGAADQRGPCPPPPLQNTALKKWQS